MVIKSRTIAQNRGISIPQRDKKADDLFYNLESLIEKRKYGSNYSDFSYFANKNPFRFCFIDADLTND